MATPLVEQVSRVIKKDFFKNSDLFSVEKKYSLPIRLAYAGLWTCCDREGRFLWKPLRLKIDVLPYDDVDFEKILDVLCAEGWIVKYSGVDNEGSAIECGVVPKFKLHQQINGREHRSELPAPPDGVEMRVPGVPLPKRSNKTAVDRLMSATMESVAGVDIFASEHEGKRAKPVPTTKWITSGGSCFRMESTNPTAVLCADEGDLSPIVDTFMTCRKDRSLSISESKVKQYEEAYSGLDVYAQLRAIRQWLIDNPGNRKTDTGFGRFLNAWLSRSQNSGGRGSGQMTNSVKSAPQMTQSAQTEIQRAAALMGIDTDVQVQETNQNKSRDLRTHTGRVIDGEIV